MDRPCLYEIILGIAQQLNAKLQGDEGEQYTMKEIEGLEDYYGKPTLENIPKKKPFWKFW